MEIESSDYDQRGDPIRRLNVFAALCCSLGPGTRIGHVETLLIIAESRGITISELARKAGLTMAAASRHVSRLKQAPSNEPKGQGFVATSRAEDARKKRLRLTKRGTEWVNAMIASMTSSALGGS